MARILELMRANGYNIDEVGMCYGIASIAVRSALKGKFDGYLERLKYIQGLDGSTKLSYDASDKNRDVLAFFDEISVFHFPSSKHLNKDDNTDAERNLRDIMPRRQDMLYVSKKLDPKFGISKKSISIVPVHKLREMFLAKKGTQENLAIMLGTGEHAMSVVYSNNQWFFVSHDHCTAGCEDLSDSFMATIAKEVGSHDVCIKEFTCAENPGPLKLYVDDEICSNPFVLQTGCMQDVTVFVHKHCCEVLKSGLTKKDKKELLLATASGSVGLPLAFVRGHVEAVKAYYAVVLQSDLTDQEKTELMLVKVGSGIPLVMLAFEEGSADLVKAYCDAVCGSGLQSEHKKELLLSKCRGCPAVALSFGRGNVEAVKAYCAAVLKSDLTEQEKTELLLAKDEGGVLCAAEAFQVGYSDVVKVYCDAVFGSGLNLDRIKQVFSSNVGLDLKGCHVESFKAYLDAVRDSSLSERDKRDLLLAKDEKGVPHAAEVFQNDRYDRSGLVKVYCDAVCGSGLPLKTIKEVFRAEKEIAGEWLHGRYRYVCSLRQSFLKGDSRVVRSYCKAVLDSRLKASEKKDLLLVGKIEDSPVLDGIQYLSDPWMFVAYSEEVFGGSRLTQKSCPDSNPSVAVAETFLRHVMRSAKDNIKCAPGLRYFRMKAVMKNIMKQQGGCSLVWRVVKDIKGTALNKHRNFSWFSMFRAPATKTYRTVLGVLTDLNCLGLNKITEDDRVAIKAIVEECKSCGVQVSDQYKALQFGHSDDSAPTPG